MLTPVDEAEAPEEKALGAAAEGNTSVRSIEVPSCMEAAAGGGRGESVGESGRSKRASTEGDTAEQQPRAARAP